MVVHNIKVFISTYSCEKIIIVQIEERKLTFLLKIKCETKSQAY